MTQSQVGIAATNFDNNVDSYHELLDYEVVNSQFSRRNR